MQELMNVLKGVGKGTIASIVTETEVKLPKKYGISGRITKVFDGQVQLNYSYESAVNNRLEGQGGERTFNALELPYGAWEKDMENLVIVHKGAYQLRMYSFNGKNKPTISYYVDGVLATTEQTAIIKEYDLGKRKDSARQSAEGLNVNQVKPRNVKFENIVRLCVCGKVYERDASVVRIAM